MSAVRLKRFQKLLFAPKKVIIIININNSNNINNNNKNNFNNAMPEFINKKEVIILGRIFYYKNNSNNYNYFSLVF